MIFFRTTGSGSESGISQWSLFTTLGSSMPDFALASSSSDILNSTGLFSSTPSKPKSLISLNLSVNDRSSLIIPKPRLFFKVTLPAAFACDTLADAIGVTNAAAPAISVADFKKLFLFILILFKFSNSRNSYRNIIFCILCQISWK